MLNLANTFRLADANPRFYDRLNAVCMVVLGAGLIIALYLALQPDLNPPHSAALETPSVETTTLQAELAVDADEQETRDAQL